MATAKYAEFIDAVQALSVTDVKRKYEEPPRKVNSADLPCSFVLFPSGDNNPLTFEGGRNFRGRAVDLVVLLEEVGATPDQPFGDTVTMMDNVEAALLTLDVGQTNPSWLVRSEIYQESAERSFWAVVATINGTG